MYANRGSSRSPEEDQAHEEHSDGFAIFVFVVTS
jgi:hypothetical protein